MNKVFRFIRRCRSIVLKMKNNIAGKMKYGAFLSEPGKVKTSSTGIVIILHEAKFGGAPLLGLHMANKYKEMGFAVHIVSLKYGEMIPQCSQICPVQVCVYKKAMKKLVKNLRDNNYTIAICNSAVTGWVVPILKNEGITTISLVHELPGVIHYLRAEKDIKLLCRISDKVIFPATYVFNQIKKEFGAITAPVKVYHQGLFAKPDFTISKKDARAELRNIYGIDDTKNLYINVATINARKGFDLFVKMSEIHPDSIFLWVGDGENSKFGKKVLSGVKRKDNLLLPGYIRDRRLMTIIYSAATALLLTSREEPFGSIVLEAFANKTPVVAFDQCGGYVDIVHSGITGALANPYDVNDMLQKAKKLSENKENYIKIANNCYAIAMNADFSEYCRKVIEE